MNIFAVYILPVEGRQYMAQAMNFVTSYKANRSSQSHILAVVCNGGDPTDEQKKIFSGVNCVFMPRSNDGYDIGAYQEFCEMAEEESIGCDIAVFFGTSTYIKTPIWTKRVAESFEKYGDTMYGCMGNAGDLSVQCYPHIRSTAFWMSPSLMNKYPIKVKSPDGRYAFEHGRNCITSWIVSIKKEPIIVTVNSEYPLNKCDSIENGFHRGNQSALLAGDRISMPPFYHTP